MGYLIEPNEKILIYKTIGDKNIELLYLPPNNIIYEKAPVYFIISGGGWHNENKVNMYNFSKVSADMLRDLGWAVISIDYSVVSMDMSLKDDISIKEVVFDVYDAMNYLNEVEDDLGIDSKRIVVSGHSAGAHLSALVAFADPKNIMGENFEKKYKIIGCVPISPIMFLYTDGPCSNPENFDHNFIFYNKTYDDAAAHLFSPYDHISKDSVRTLFVHGTDDDLVNVENSIFAFYRGKELGAPFELLTPVNAGHAFECKKNGYIYPSAILYQQTVATFVSNLID